jgi:hypothetical protein
MNKAQQIEYLQKFLTPNKARGMAGEISFDDYLVSSDTVLANKMFAGAWIIAPNKSDATNPVHYRIAVFVLPITFSTENELNNYIAYLTSDRGHQALFSNLKNSGLGVIVCGAICNESETPDDFIWKNFIYLDRELVEQTENEPFMSLTQGRGRATPNKEAWSQDVVNRFNNFSEENLLKLTLKQAFYYSYFKLKLKAAFVDQYDVDGFLVGDNGNTFPVEIKEKSRTEKDEFGIDAGRILMMMRICMTTDSNALYIIREVDNTESRNLIGYKYITLADMIMNVRWNLQAGGIGMSGGSTQTVMMPADSFSDFSVGVLREDWINQNCSLITSVKEKAVLFYNALENLLRQQ